MNANGVARLCVSGVPAAAAGLWASHLFDRNNLYRKSDRGAVRFQNKTPLGGLANVHTVNEVSANELPLTTFLFSSPLSRCVFVFRAVTWSRQLRATIVSTTRCWLARPPASSHCLRASCCANGPTSPDSTKSRSDHRYRRLRLFSDQLHFSDLTPTSMLLEGNRLTHSLA